MPELKPLAIGVVSDVVCPWCYIGKRRLEKALGILEGEIVPSITWLPFQLNPQMPKEGMARADYRRAKFGSLQHSKQLDARVSSEGAGEGIAFAFERMERTPNTFAAHQLIDLAQQQGAGDAVVDALFRAYFEEAKDTSNPEVLKSIAEACGVPAQSVEARWADAKEASRVAQLEGQMKALGISGVPTFILGRKVGISGAHPPETLVKAIRDAAAKAA